MLFLDPAAGELRIHRSHQLDLGKLLVIVGFGILVLLGEGFNLFGEFLIVTCGLFQVLKLLVTGLDALIELGDLGFPVP